MIGIFLAYFISPTCLNTYHLDGNKVMMTHCCSAKNQPRMQLFLSGEEQDIHFEFVNATKLKDKKEGYLQGGLQIIFDDDNHIRQIRTWKEGEKQMPGTF